MKTGVYYNASHDVLVVVVDVIDYVTKYDVIYIYDDNGRVITEHVSRKELKMLLDIKEIIYLGNL